jgi:hypothetical protein
MLRYSFWSAGSSSSSTSRVVVVLIGVDSTWLDVQRFPPSPTWSEARERTTILPS